ncbi:MAG: MBL fold metallo-hydrolase [Thermoplasmatales archaeon]|nr:MBL fold metallo-hydrolase [Thermoplasmatales archaeon]
MTDGIKRLKITVMNDNEPSEGLKNDWGWSVLLESDEWKILFDADTRSDVIEYNSKHLGINLAGIDFAFLSHSHHDHYGGFEYLGSIRKGLKVYTPERIRILESWGLDPVIVDDEKELVNNVYSTGPMGSMFIREHAMVIRGNGFNVLIVGCSHPGIDKIASKAYGMLGRIHLIIGGFHGPSERQIDYIAQISDHISPAHCSGDSAKNYVMRKYREKYVKVKTGSILELPLK